MGGRVILCGEQAVPIPLRKRDERAFDLCDFVTELHEIAPRVIPNLDAAVDGSLFSGSTVLMMNASISAQEIAKIGKEKFGDIDIQVPDTVQADVLALLSKPDLRLGKFRLIGFKRFGPTICSLWYHDDGDVNQIDFELKPFEKGRPSAFSQMSNNSHIDDLRQGLRGVLHKYLLNACTFRRAFLGEVRVVQKRSIKFKQDWIRDYTFAPSHGLRQKHKWVGDELYEEVAPHETPYITDLQDVYRRLFGYPYWYQAPRDRIEKLSSFVGVASLIRDVVGPVHQVNIAEAFVRRMFGDQGQLLGATAQEDADIKMKGISVLAPYLSIKAKDALYDTKDELAHDFYNRLYSSGKIDRPDEGTRESDQYSDQPASGSLVRVCNGPENG